MRPRGAALRYLTLYIHCNKIFGRAVAWNEAKNARLRQTRGVGFEEVIAVLESDGPLWTTDHPHPDRYPGQKLLAVLLSGYIVVVPFEVKDETIEFKTLYPSRKATREWRKGRPTP
jgi:uncharacterized DUF497 family protein